MVDQREWQARLNDAHSTEDVLGAVRDFISQWTPEQIDELPEECRPGRLDDADDVAMYALALAQKQCATEGIHVSLRMHAMASFIMNASHRISQILAIAAHRTATTGVRI